MADAVDEYDELADSLIDIGYPPQPSHDQLVQWVSDGESSKQYVQLCEFLVRELLGHPIGQPFASSFAKHLTQLEFHMDARNLGKDPVMRLMALEFLVAEVATGHIREKQTLDTAVSSGGSTEGAASGTRGVINEHLGVLSAYLALKKTTHAAEVLEQAIQRAPAVIGKADLTPVLAEGSLTEDERAVLREINRVMNSDYSKRRQTMLTRFKVTLQAFQWSDKRDADMDGLVKVSSNLLEGVNVAPAVVFDQIFRVSRPFLAATEVKVSGEDRRKLGTTAIHKNISIGVVPDRGGRTNTYSFETRVEIDVGRANAELKGKLHSGGGGKGKGKGKGGDGYGGGGGGSFGSGGGYGHGEKGGSGGGYNDKGAGYGKGGGGGKSYGDGKGSDSWGGKGGGGGGGWGGGPTHSQSSGRGKGAVQGGWAGGGGGGRY